MGPIRRSAPLKVSLLCACAAAAVLLALAAPRATAAAAGVQPVPYPVDADSPARRLFEVLGADEPLLAADVQDLLQQLSAACRAPPGGAPPQQRLSVAQILQRFGRGGALDEGAAAKACTAIMACQLDSTCALGDLSHKPGTHHHHDSGGGGSGGGGEVDAQVVSMALRAAVAVGLGLEALLGIYIPILLKSVAGYEWWLSLLNCFSGGVFVAAGLVHLLPHCQESQQQLASLAGTDYPLYLVLIVAGYMLVLFVERVLFSVHDAAHAHTHTGIVSRRNSFEIVLPPGALEAAAAAAAAGGSGGGSEGAHGHDDDAHGHGHGPAAAAAAAAGAGAPSGASTPSGSGVRTRRQAAAAAAAGEAGKPLLGGGASPRRGGGGSGGNGGHAHSHSHGAGGGHSHGHMTVCRHGHTHEGAGTGGDLRQGLVLLVAMSVHTWLECMALGLLDGRREFFVLLGAIASHKLISGLALSSRFLKEGATTRQVLTCVGPFSLIAPLAVASGVVVRGVDPMLTLVLSCFATGTFLYVGMSEIVEEEFEGDMRSGRTDISQAFARWCKFLCLAGGVAMIALLAALPDAHDHAHGVHGGGHHHHHHHHR